MPAPVESWGFSEALGWSPWEHYGDAVWDNVRMNNIAVHFVTAFLNEHLKGETGPWLELTPNSNDGTWAMEEDGETPAEGHTYWAGFPNRSAVGLRFETLE